MLAQGASLGATGTAIGIVLALILERVFRGLLGDFRGVQLAMGWAAAVFLLTLTVASYDIPARRASRIDPRAALLTER